MLIGVNKWTETSNRYQEIFANSRYADQAQAMIELLTAIHAQPGFEDVAPGTSLAVLTLEPRNSQIHVRVWFDAPDTYTVQFYSFSGADYPKDNYVVNRAEVIDVLRRCLNEARNLE